MKKQSVSRRDFLKGTAAGAATIALTGILGACSSSSETEAAETQAATEAEETEAVTEAETEAAAETAEAAPATGTRYTNYANPDRISYQRDESEMSRIEDADVVVVGSGLGGFMASMIVKEQMPGANVIMLEKNAYLGGSTNFAECNTPSHPGMPETLLSNAVNSASNTGYIADPMLHYEMNKDKGINSAWLFEKHNVQWSGMFYADGGYDGLGEGSSCIATLTEENEDVGVDIRTENQAVALVMEDEYTCTGIQVHDTANNEYYQINCKAVVLATGGMANTMDEDGLCQYYTGQDMCKCIGWGSGQSGDGQLMVEQTAHGKSKSMTVVGQFINVKDFAYDSALGACVAMQASDLWINQDGIRFTAESSGVGKMVETQGSVFSVVGQNLIDFWNAGGCNKKISGFADVLVGADLTQPVERPMPDKDGNTVYVDIDLQGEIEEYKDNPEVWSGDTIEELAAAIKADVPVFNEEEFIASVERYEEFCAAAAEGGEESADEDFGKANEYLVSLGDGPYYAFRLVSSVLNTCGGIRINRNAQVVDPRYNPIEGLYASGICTSGWDGEIYGGGTCQPVCMWASSKAARCIVEDVLGGTVADDWYGDDPEGYCEPQASMGPPM